VRCEWHFGTHTTDSNVAVLSFSPMNIQGILAALHLERERLTQAIAALESIGSTHPSQRSATEAASSGRKRRVSAESRRRMAQAQRARWAKVKGQGTASQRSATANVTPIKRTMSASARRKIAAAQRARWAKVKKAA
jgi:hypothetical protein